MWCLSREVVHTGNENILIVGDKVLENFLGAVDNVHISPVDPGVLRLEGSREEVVARATHSLATGTLGSERVALRNILAQLEVEVLLDNHGAAEGYLIGALLDAVKLGSKDSKSVIGRVADEEGKIDQVVGVGKLGDQLKVLGEIPRGILEGGKDQDALLVGDGLGGRLDGVEVDVGDGGRVDFYRSVVVEDNRGMKVSTPSLLLIKGHLHWRF